MFAATTRFAPSPTGPLHLGHAYSALFAAAAGRRFLLRIEDIDAGRCREPYIDAIADDLAWLGLQWEQPVRRQSRHLADYAQALGRLEALGLLYPCFCTRADILRQIDGAAAAPQGPDGPLYPRLCRGLAAEEGARRKAAGDPFALRLDMSRAVALTGTLTWTDLDQGVIAAEPQRFGDVVLARKDIPVSYHLAVTVDDALQGVDLVTRGLDLFPATHIHRLLQALLNLPVPRWRHHRLLTDTAGRRLAKRDAARSLQSYREAGLTAAEVRRLAGWA
jgi:glutamyl-Q tRNA(Asp) synthetase